MAKTRGMQLGELFEELVRIAESDKRGGLAQTAISGAQNDGSTSQTNREAVGFLRDIDPDGGGVLLLEGARIARDGDEILGRRMGELREFARLLTEDVLAHFDGHPDEPY